MSRDVIISDSEEETLEAGRQLAATLGPGETVLLFGELGTGKTAFVRGIAEGLGASADEVSSPTFTLVQQYSGRQPIFHVDLYRLQPGREVSELDLEGLADSGGVVLVEWADRLLDPPADAVVARIEDLGGDRRRISVLRSLPTYSMR
jgi:tRNA threonylcarbamoyladenosine biosynthesis protein TsaE